jgi:hypothetical protein
MKERQLRNLAGVGKATLADFASLGVRSLAALPRADGLRLSRRVEKLTRERQDPCVPDVFRCAVAQARDPRLPAAQRHWWWSRKRKAGR